MDFKRKKLLTIPVLKLAVDETRYVKITGVMHLGKEVTDKDGKTRDPATLAPCINLETGEQAQIVVSAVVKGVLADEYPGDSYVGKCFALTKLDRVEGKAYNGFTVEEIEEPAGTVAAGNGEEVSSKTHTPPPAQPREPARARAR